MTTPPPGGGPYQQPQYGQYPPQFNPTFQPPRKKRKVWPWVLGGVILVIVLFFGGCLLFVGGAVNEVDKESKREVTVVYRVTGSGGSASITWTDKDFNIAQETNARLPWEKSVTISGLGKSASLTVTNGTDDNATSKCEIVVDGQVKYTQTATGPFASATCSGDVG